MYSSTASFFVNGPGPSSTPAATVFMDGPIYDQPGPARIGQAHDGTSHTHACARAHTHANMHTDAYKYTHAHMHTHTYTYTHIRTHTLTYMNTTHTHNTHTNTQTHTHTYTHKHTHTLKHTHTHTHTHTQARTYESLNRRDRGRYGVYLENEFRPQRASLPIKGIFNMNL